MCHQRGKHGVRDGRRQQRRRRQHQRARHRRNGAQAAFAERDTRAGTHWGSVLVHSQVCVFASPPIQFVCVSCFLVRCCLPGSPTTPCGKSDLKVLPCRADSSLRASPIFQFVCVSTFRLPIGFGGSGFRCVPKASEFVVVKRSAANELAMVGGSFYMSDVKFNWADRRL